MVDRIKKWNTLRNQILVIFLFVMIIVLSIVSIITLRQVSLLIKNNAEDQIRQTAVEASGRIDSLFEQLNTATKSIMTNHEVQKLFERMYLGKSVTFAELQGLKSIVNNIQANSEGVYSVELYTTDLKQIFPLNDSTKMFQRINVKWIHEAEQAKGKLVWIGEDPKNDDFYLAIRRISLIEHNFENGGYLLVRINKPYFSITEVNTQQYLFVLDHEWNPIFSNFSKSIDVLSLKHQSTTKINQIEYMVTKQSSTKGFTVVILTPVSALTKGMNGIRLGIIFAGIIGIVIYFLCSLFLSNMITKPIVNLTKTMRLANEGLLTIDPETITVNEIRELNSTYNQLVRETNHLIKTVYQKEIIRSQSELKALQAQINPHFLYNTLESLRWSLEEKGEEDLADVVVSMSDLFRYTISRNSNDDWVTLKEEFDHIGNYIEIIKFRFGDRIKWCLLLPEALEHVKIPKLLIQPLVENAVVHGSENQLASCTITVAAELASDSYIQIVVEDDGVGMDEERLQAVKQAMDTGDIISKSGKGMALHNVKKRLQLYYNEEISDSITICSHKNKGTKITLKIPVNGGET
ncbi:MULTISPECIES: sensor histidine kinase [Geobacillus]|jgi:two-component system, sensor histidine kinase YesM|uniref:histidine kinase n=3 Tax=Geobacillus TaxID=129337 RepID=A4IP92_GEOTN|nr:MULTISPECIES: sensor histidine kinase [Geobacillus]ABO67146.1 Two-component sensor histidine kinase [Geobacillus thermodenitrificans NG80-2]ARA99621.1 sensor histidine kinase [Geobacillus thermodenitrificans]ARP42908.1 putative sensor-like histidine kinase [Geobacillus thermodenitrificans]ATO35828.1 sensor histidine kinase [Geobacillus thermodenitrificans]MED3718596.1 sensor histidine kinase [Geobacillus thermodenitrificans]